MFRFWRGGALRALIVSPHPKTYLFNSMVRLFSLMVAAMALFFSPIAMMSGSGLAMAHAPVASTSSSVDGHCDDSGQDEHGQSSGMEAGCATACAAMPASEPSASTGRAPPVQLSVATLQLRLGIFPEGDTPPPRITPEI